MREFSVATDTRSDSTVPAASPTMDATNSESTLPAASRKIAAPSPESTLQANPREDILALYEKQFNWGAFLLTPIWAFAHRRLWFGLLWLAPDFLPFPRHFGLIAQLAIGLYIGFFGNKIAVKIRKFQSVQQFVSVERAWTRWGVGVTIIGYIASAIAFYYIGNLIGWNTFLGAFAKGLNS